MNDETIKPTTLLKPTTNIANEIYRKLLATANKLATLQGNLVTVADFFLNPSVKFYHAKLCNESLKLLFESNFNLDYYRKAEELIWKRIYHDIYKFQKTKRKVVTKHDECLMEAHFISGIGFYSTLVLKLRYSYKIQDLHGLIEPLNLKLSSQKVDSFIKHNQLGHSFEEDSLMGSMLIVGNKSVQNKQINHEDGSSARKETNLNVTLAKEWARQAIYRSLVYMGDLARYLLETSLIDYRELAFNFYCSASKNQPDYGLPFNQLATLAGDSNYNLHSVTNYMRCCLKPKPFDGAESNMRKLFQLNENVYNEEFKQKNYIAKMSEVLASVEPSQAAETMVKAIIVIFIKLTSDLWSATITGSLDKDSLIEETHLFFESLREALELEPIVPLATNTNEKHRFTPISVGSIYHEKPKYITPTIMYEFCCVSMMLISKCQSTKPSEILIEIEPFPTESLKDLVNTLALNLLHYSTTKCHKMVMGKVQEYRILRQHEIETRVNLEPLNDVFKTKTLLGNHDSMNGLDTKLDNENQNSALTHIYTQTYLPTIKIFCDWLLANSDIIELNLQSFHSFCSDLGELNSLLRSFKELTDKQLESDNPLLNSFNREEEDEDEEKSIVNSNNHDLSISSDASHNSEVIFGHIFDGPAWKQKYPLSCDFPLYNLKPLQNVHKLNIDFYYTEELNEAQSGFITMQCIEAFLFALTIFLKNKPSD